MGTFLPNISAAFGFVGAFIGTISGLSGLLNENPNTMKFTGLMLGSSAAWSLVKIAWKD